MTIIEAVSLAQELLPEARLWIRRTATNLDTEIQQTIAACLLDLNRVGIAKISADDPLICQAARLYLKSQFSSGVEAERFLSAYEHLRDALSLSGEYTVVNGDG